MKRFLILLIVALLVLVPLCSCAQQEDVEPEEDQGSVEQEPVYTPEPAEPPIAFVMNGQTQFNEVFMEAVQPQVEAAGYRLITYYSESDAVQVDDMYAAIGSGVECIVVSPFDMDNLNEVLDEADMQGIPVVNVIVPITGLVQTLISPDYSEIGAMAADAALQARPDGANVLMVDNLLSPFVAQMKRDGFQTRAEELGKVTLIGAVLVDGTQERVQQETAEALSADESINTVFSTEEAFLDSVLAAVSESGRDVTVITTGGGSAVMDAVENGTAYTGIFASPVELAQIAGEYAIMLASDSKAAVLEFEWLKLEMITKETVAQYRATGTYADILTPAEPTPSPEAQVSGEPEPGEQPQEEDDAEAGEEDAGQEQAETGAEE